MRLADETLRKITINIFESDYFWLLDNCRHSGYQEEIRKIIRAHIRKRIQSDDE